MDIREQLRELEHAARRNAKANKNEAEWLATIEGENRLIIAMNVRIFEAVMHLAETSGTDEQLAALTARLLAADAKFDAATG